MENIGCIISIYQNERGIVMISVKKNQAPDGHKCQTTHNIPIQWISLNALFEPKIRNPQIYSVELSSQIYWTPCTDT